MSKIKMLETTRFEDRDYIRGEVYEVEAQTARALGTSVEVLKADKKAEKKVEEVAEKNKQIDSAPADKMMHGAVNK